MNVELQLTSVNVQVDLLQVLGYFLMDIEIDFFHFDRHDVHGSDCKKI